MAKSSRSLILVLSLSLGLLILTACGSGGTAPDDSVDVPETTKVMDDATTNALVSFDDNGTLRFSTETDLLSSLEDGDVFVGGITDTRAPRGFLRTVTTVRTESGEVVVETDNATLAQAIDRADASFQQDVSSQHIVGVQHHAPGITLIHPQQDQSAFSLDFSETLLSVQGVEVAVNGRFEFDADLIFEVEIDKSEPLQPETWIKRFKAAALLQERADLELVATGSIQEQAREELTTVNIANIQFLIGPVPVVITADLTFFLEFDGSISAEVTTGVVQTASLETGGLYSYPDGWSGINETSSSFDYTPPALEISASARAAAGSTLSIGLYSADAAAGSITGRAFLDAEFEASAYPLWCLYGGLNASYGYVIAVPKIGTIADFEKVFAEFREEIACADNIPPTIDIVSPTDGATFDEATEIVFEAQASDIENTVDIDWTVDGSSTGVLDPTLSLQTLCPGDHTVTATATDEQGASTRATITVTIENRAPTVTIASSVINADDIDLDSSFKLEGTANDPTCDNLDGTNIDLNRLEWDVQDGFGGTGAGLITSFTSTGQKTITLTFTDPAGAAASTTATVSVVENGRTYGPLAVIERPQDGKVYDYDDLINDSTAACYRIDVRADVSSSVSDDNVIWSYREQGTTDFVEFARGRDSTLERTCTEVSGAAGMVEYELRVNVAGELSNPDATDVNTIALKYLGG